MKKFGWIIFGLFLFCVIPAFAQETTEIRIYSIFVTRGTESITISWRTDPKSKTKLEYADVSGQWKETPWSDVYTEQHNLTLLNLIADSSYLYKISAEDESGKVSTKTGSFTTLSADLYGSTEDTTNTDNGGFKNLLTPAFTLSPSPTPTSMYPSVLGAQNYAYIPLPVVMPYTYLPATTPIAQPSANPTQEIVAATDTNNSLISSNDSQSITLIIGLIAGVVMTFLMYQLTLMKNPSSRETSPIIHNENTPSQQLKNTQSSLPNTYTFSIKGKN